jgi:acyl phosphate:glycerol-3-phosphate acyltransferase
MDILYYIAFLILAYLLGAIPSAVWIGRILYGLDVRDHGSGNSGTTNSLRVLGAKAGILVLLIDVLKGVAAVSLSHLFPNIGQFHIGLIEFQSILGLMALMGHIYPVCAGFRGGKGVATLLGVILTMHLYTALLTVGLFIIVLTLFKYVSLSSIISAIAFPFLLIYVFHFDSLSIIIFAFSVPLIVILTHHNNIQRLFKNEESRISVWKKQIA